MNVYIKGGHCTHNPIRTGAQPVRFSSDANRRNFSKIQPRHTQPPHSKERVEYEDGDCSSVCGYLVLYVSTTCDKQTPMIRTEHAIPNAPIIIVRRQNLSITQSAIITTTKYSVPRQVVGRRAGPRLKSRESSKTVRELSVGALDMQRGVIKLTLHSMWRYCLRQSAGKLAK